ncbi:MAG: hypothetical protein HGA45_37585 [Chloroflexales bacterium]|nr:hypothetical protein [Chloroflexales bacterium]
MLVCWALLGGTVEGLLRPRGRALAVVSAIVVADLLFGLFHYAHSAPFNQLSMVPRLVGRRCTTAREALENAWKVA